MSAEPGKFITLEGGEGVGKSTNLKFVKEYLTNKGIPTVTTREPGGTPVAEKIRELLLMSGEEKITDQAELLLVFAARAQHLAQVIKPALDRGEWVLCDRFTDATYAYQGAGRGLPVADIESLEDFVQGGLRPDLTLLLDTTSGVGMGRVKSRNEKPDRFELEEIAFFDRIRSCYLARSAKFPERMKIVNAEMPLADVQAQIGKALDTLIPCR